MPLWASAFDRDSAALADFLQWINVQRQDTIRAVFDRKLTLDVGIGVKKILDDLERCATMNTREQRANQRFDAETTLSKEP